MRSITLRFMFAFAALSLISTLLIVVITRWRSREEFRTFLIDENRPSVVGAFAQYYQQHGSWSGIAASNFLPHQMPMAAPQLDPGPYTLVDSSTDRVILAGTGYQLGMMIPSTDLPNSVPIQDGNRTVGLLIINRPLYRIGPPGSAFLDRFNLQILLGGLIGIGLALLLALALSQNLTRPIRELTAATKVVSGGAMGHQVGAVALWGVVHSWLASVRARAVARQLWADRSDRFYRIAYNVFSVASFVPILVLARVLPDRLIYLVAAPWMYVMVAAQVSTVILLTIVLLQTDPLSFAGLRQLAEGEGPSQLVTNGFYGRVRHPLYLFGFLFLWLTPIMTANLLALFASLTGYLFAGAIFEERKLVAEFGSAYAEYRSHTPMILPRFELLRRRPQHLPPPKKL